MNTHIVFDLDGTLSDTQKIHQEIESNFLKDKGVIIHPEEIGKKFAGRTPQEWISEVFIENTISFSNSDLENFVSKKDEMVIKLLKKGKIYLMPQAKEILEYLYNKGYKIGISSGACREFIDEFIKYFKLENIILASTSANEVINKKPYPDVFLSSFKKLEANFGTPNNKYVIGDGWSDVEGGYKAGAKTVWLNYGYKTKKDELLCHFEIQSLNELLNIL